MLDFIVINRLRCVLAVFLLMAPLANAGEVAEVSILKMEFIPQHVKIKPGTTVKWVNNEKRNNHSVYFEKEGLPESDRFFPGESWQRTFEKPGVYPYRCGPHPEMTGVIEVAK
ncbi:MAG: plastocyanin/azurin family copper-binding protein [Sulfuricella sp.]|nr:plastocyanin/azurin family copper-binding protein [Sulfuricella sp.]